MPPTPALHIDTDVDPGAPFRDLPAVAPAFHVCDGFEDEAAAAAAQVLVHVERGDTPVALIAQDRALVRRIRALLERSEVVMRDETGWRLSTTRAGATVMALLAAARRDASADAWLDWLKAAPIGTARTGALEALEAALRRAQVADALGLARLPLDAVASALRDDAKLIVDTFARAPRRSLVEWLDALAAALDGAGSLDRLRADAAGRQALATLGIDPPVDEGRRAQLSADLEPMTLADFTRWVDDVFERETFLPPDAVDDESLPLPADVVITPLARAMLRPFAAAVLPGADDRRLGAMSARDSLLPRSIEHALGLADPIDRREAELLAFAQLLRLPKVTLFRRRIDGADPLANSAFVDWLGLALAERRLAWRAWQDPRIEERVAPMPIRPSAPSVGADRLPRRLSASTFEALRDCPYRFFAQSVLGLRAVDELDAEVEKRDYGKWLHEVLHVFHLDREAGADVGADTARLLAIGAASLESLGLDAAAFLPFSASFQVLVPRYVTWLHEREASGVSWSRGEAELRAMPEALGGIELYGRIDRIDVVGDGSRLELIDYKTGSASQLKKDVIDRFEDTQLAFYAALVGAESDLPLRAFYLAMDATRGLEVHEHVDVAATASVLMDGLAEDLRRLREGQRCRPSAKARPASIATHAACVVATTGRPHRRQPARMTGPAFRIDGQPATRESFYAVACDPSRSCVVEACAGSGKTWMLVSRMLRALLDGALPHEILAITFTRAAAGEMRQRLHDWLADYSAPRSTHAERVEALVLRGIAPARAEKLADELASLYGRVLAAGRPIEIRTFHAWFAQLLRVAPMALLDRLGLAPEMELIEDIEDHRPAVMRAFHARVLRDPALRDDYAAMTARRGRTQLGKWLAAAWWRRVEFEMADEAGVLAESVVAAGELWPETARFEHPVEAVFDASGRLACATSPKSSAAARGPSRTQVRRSPPRSRQATRGVCSSGLARAVHPGGRAARADQGHRRSRRHAAVARAAAAAGRPAGCADRAPAHGQAGPRTARGVRRLQARTRLCRHGRPRALRPCDPAR